MVKIERSFPAPESLAIEAQKTNDVFVHANDRMDEEAVLTAELVDEVFHLCNTGVRVYKSDYRLKKLQEEMNVLYTKLEMYRNMPESRGTLRMLKALLRRESAFAGFKRCYVRAHLDEFPGLEEYIA